MRGKKVLRKEKLVVILGPTATGKSRCGIELAGHFGGEIISGDSMLVYRQMDIGTAKPSFEELSRIPHHLVNILPPDAVYSVADFQQQAAEKIREIAGRGKLPVLVGGTGLYIRALLEKYRFSPVGEDASLRRELEAFARDRGPEALHERLQEADPASAARLHPHDVRRVVRALEAALSGVAVSREREEGPVYDALVFGLSMEREFLYQRINARVDNMLEQGLEWEVRSLLKQGVPPDSLSLKSLGYRQMVEYIQGQCSLEEAAENIKKGTRHFAKRQITWYKSMPYVQWLEVTRELNYEQIVERMEASLVKTWKRL